MQLLYLLDSNKDKSSLPKTGPVFAVPSIYNKKWGFSIFSLVYLFKLKTNDILGFIMLP